MSNTLEKIIQIYESDDLTSTKLDNIFELCFLKKNKDFKLPTNEELLKQAKKIIKEKKLNINKLKLNKDNYFTFQVNVSAGCYGDWVDVETLSPFIFYYKIIKPNL